MICQNCGKELPENATFCSECGSAQVVEEVKEEAKETVETEVKKTSNRRGRRKAVKTDVDEVKEAVEEKVEEVKEEVVEKVNEVKEDVEEVKEAASEKIEEVKEDIVEEKTAIALSLQEEEEKIEPVKTATKEIETNTKTSKIDTDELKRNASVALNKSGSFLKTTYDKALNLLKEPEKDCDQLETSQTVFLLVLAALAIAIMAYRGFSWLSDIYYSIMYYGFYGHGSGFKFFVYFVLAAVLALLAVVVCYLVAKKVNKEESDFKSAVKETAGRSVPFTCLMLMGILLSFVAPVLAYMLVALAWGVFMVPAFEKLKKMNLYGRVALMFGMLLFVFFVGSILPILFSF